MWALLRLSVLTCRLRCSHAPTRSSNRDAVLLRCLCPQLALFDAIDPQRNLARSTILTMRGAYAMLHRERSLGGILEPAMGLATVYLTHKRASVNGVNLHYVTVGSGPAIVCLHGWPQNHREFLPFFDTFSNSYRLIAPDLRGYADSDKPYTDYMPATIAQDMLELADVEGTDRFHILSHDLGGPPSVALAYMAGKRALSLATIETPFFGLDYPDYVDPRVAYWHLGMHANMD